MSLKEKMEIQETIVQEFVEKVSKTPELLGVIVTIHIHLLHIWVCLSRDIPRKKQYAVYKAESDILQKYASRFPLEFNSKYIASIEQLEELSLGKHSYIIYQRESDANSDRPSTTS